MQHKIPVLFTSENSLYNNYEIFDCYDEKRNALTCTQRKPAIYHPPCRLFSKLKGMSTAPKAEKKLAYYSLSKVRQFGGILEHPKGSDLFKFGNFDLSGKIDKYGGFLREVNLNWFGFPAQKKTILYFVGISPKELPPFPISFEPVQYCISTPKTKGHICIPKKLRSQTPDLMIQYFIEVISIINNKNTNHETTK